MINIKTEREIELMRKAGEIVGMTHHYLEAYLKPGITTKELDVLAEKFILEHNATPSFKGLYGFPKMGIQGAAMGTCIAQIVSLLVHILFAYYTHQPFIGTLQEMFTFDMHFVKPILQKTQSIIFNLFLDLMF